VTIGSVVLAAGAATRFGAPKQELMLGEVLTRLASAPVDEIVVVAGAYPLTTGPDTPAHGRVRVVDCPGWRLGGGASLRCGLAALSARVDAAVVVLADGPDLAPESVSRVVQSWQEHGGDVVAAAYGGVRGHPVLLARAAWDDVPDEGFRSRHARLVPCDDLGPPGDVDTPADLPQRLA
jgi:nicotine blue oxidoreductase